MTPSQEQRLRDALERFKVERGKHDGEHKFCCENGRCFLCEESYVRAEARLDEALPTLKRVLEMDLSHARDAVARGEMQQKRMPFDHDNNDALERDKVCPRSPEHRWRI